MPIEAVGPTSGVRPTTSVYRATSPPETTNPFSAFVEGFLQTRLPDARHLYYEWLKGQDPDARLAAIADLEKQLAENARSRQEAEVEYGKQDVDRKKLEVEMRGQDIHAAETTAEIQGRIEVLIRESADPEIAKKLGEAQSLAIEMAAASAAGDKEGVKNARDQLVIAAGEAERLSNVSGKLGERSKVGATLAEIEALTRAAAENSRNKIPFDPVDLGGAPIERSDPGVGVPPRIDVSGPAGGSVSVRTKNVTSGTVPQAGTEGQPAAGGGGGQGKQIEVEGQAPLTRVLGPDFFDKTDAELLRAIENIENNPQWRSGGDQRATPYDPLTPRAYTRDTPNVGDKAAAFLRTGVGAGAAKKPPEGMERQRPGKVADAAAADIPGSTGPEPTDATPPKPSTATQIIADSEFDRLMAEPAKPATAAAAPGLKAEATVRKRAASWEREPAELTDEQLAKQLEEELLRRKSNPPARYPGPE